MIACSLFELNKTSQLICNLNRCQQRHLYYAQWLRVYSLKREKHQLECSFKLQVSTEPWYFNWIVFVKKRGGVDFSGNKHFWKKAWSHKKPYHNYMGKNKITNLTKIKILKLGHRSLHRTNLGPSIGGPLHLHQEKSKKLSGF